MNQVLDGGHIGRDLHGFIRGTEVVSHLLQRWDDDSFDPSVRPMIELVMRFDEVNV